MRKRLEKLWKLKAPLHSTASELKQRPLIVDAQRDDGYRAVNRCQCKKKQRSSDRATRTTFRSLYRECMPIITSETDARSRFPICSGHQEIFSPFHFSF